jgi:hypothetical protein
LKIPRNVKPEIKKTARHSEKMANTMALNIFNGRYIMVGESYFMSWFFHIGNTEETQLHAECLFDHLKSSSHMNTTKIGLCLLTIDDMYKRLHFTTVWGKEAISTISFTQKTAIRELAILTSNTQHTHATFYVDLDDGVYTSHSDRGGIVKKMTFPLDIEAKISEIRI